MKLRAVWYYGESDTDFSGDYYELKVYQGRKLVRRWRDYYHDKGDVKLDGFIDGIEFATGEKVDLTHQRKNLDYD